MLELGCGWGSLTLWMAERTIPNCAHHGRFSNSASQREFIESHAHASAALATCAVITAT
jgi:cyclopropane fatty-acyl-phospholipid synthase-like methyltransferase